MRSATGAGNFEQLKNPAINADLAKLRSPDHDRGSAQVPDPDRAVRGNAAPGHPDRLRCRVRRVQLVELTVAVRLESVSVGQPGSPQNEIVVLHLKPKS